MILKCHLQICQIHYLLWGKKMSNVDDNINIIVANINNKLTVLYDNESDRLSDILSEINEILRLDTPAYIKAVDKKKYLVDKDNAVALNELIS